MLYYLPGSSHDVSAPRIWLTQAVILPGSSHDVSAAWSGLTQAATVASSAPLIKCLLILDSSFFVSLLTVHVLDWHYQLFNT